MPGKSKIEWCTHVLNSVTGCDKVSAGCKNCYAETFAERWRGTPGHPYEQGFDLRLWPERLDIPRKWTKHRRIFLNSMSDCFHKDIPLDFLKRTFEMMNECPQHVFQILTKRHERLAELADQFTWTDNIWMGVSVEDSHNVQRIDSLREVPARIRFLSCEPLIGSLTLEKPLDLAGISWVIGGGESGPGARYMSPRWIKEIMRACKHDGVPFFMKQTGTMLAKLMKLQDRKGGDIEEWPEWMRVREWPRGYTP